MSLKLLLSSRKFRCMECDWYGFGRELLWLYHPLIADYEMMNCPKCKVTGESLRQCCSVGHCFEDDTYITHYTNRKGEETCKNTCYEHRPITCPADQEVTEDEFLFDRKLHDIAGESLYYAIKEDEDLGIVIGYKAKTESIVCYTSDSGNNEHDTPKIIKALRLCLKLEEAKVQNDN